MMSLLITCFGMVLWAFLAFISKTGACSDGWAAMRAGLGLFGEQRADATTRAAQRLWHASQPLYSHLFIPISQQPGGWALCLPHCQAAVSCKLH